MDRRVGIDQAYALGGYSSVFWRDQLDFLGVEAEEEAHSMRAFCHTILST